MSVRIASLSLAALLGAACLGAQTPSIKSPKPDNTTGVLRAERVATGLENPWGLAFLPDGQMIVTERAGRLRYVAKDGTLSAPVTGTPTVLFQGQGGLLDVAVDPKFAQNKTIYLSFSEPGEGGTA